MFFSYSIDVKAVPWDLWTSKYCKKWEWEQRMSGLKIEAEQQRLGQLTANQSIFIRSQKDINF